MLYCVLMKKNFIWFFLILFLSGVIIFIVFPKFFGGISYKKGDLNIVASVPEKEESKKKFLPVLPPLDKAAYDAKMEELANNPLAVAPPATITTPPAGTPPPQGGEELPEPKNVSTPLWPVKTVYPNAGAILPFKRVIAYYGNLYSRKMGVLGEYSEEEMLAKLDVEVKKWEAADPSTPVLPALHYIAVVAQGSAGKDGKYRARMPDSEIDKVIAMAEKINAIVFLDIQVGFSTIEDELPRLEKYFKMPNVHLGMDPEFSMKSGIRPGKAVGTFDAADINFAASYLAKIARENNLTPKILVVHRYTGQMVTNSKQIKPLPEVQIVMHMDGWGGKEKKIGTYKLFIVPEPVQFAGFKLFYKSDIKTPGTVLMTPADLLKLSPQPIYIQYQ